MIKCFVIVVKGHELSERVGNMAIQSGKVLGWDTELFEAVDGRKTSLADLASYGLRLDTSHKKQVRQMERPGPFGNFLSHWKLWNLCVELNQPIGCFEHDVIFQKPIPLDILNFRDLLKFDLIKVQKPYGTGTCYQGAHAHIIKPSGAKKLIDYCFKNGVMAADIMIGTDVLDIDFNLTGLTRFNDETHTPDGIALKSTSKTMSF